MLRKYETTHNGRSLFRTAIARKRVYARSALLVGQYMYSPKALVFLLMASICTQGQTGLRIKITAHSELSPRHARIAGGERTWFVYAANDRTRTEISASRFPATVTIQRCDTHKFYTLDVERREYVETSLPSGKSASSKSTEQKTGSSPNLLIDTTTHDTGETKPAFGHLAHHYIIRTKETPSAEFNVEPSERVVDAWYLDVPDVMTCEAVLPWRENFLFSGLVRRELFVQMMSRVRPEFKFSGTEPRGLLLSATATSNWIEMLATGEQQKNVLYEWRKIVEMSEESIDPTLFEVPIGYTKVEKIRPKY